MLKNFVVTSSPLKRTHCLCIQLLLVNGTQCNYTKPKKILMLRLTFKHPRISVGLFFLSELWDFAIKFPKSSEHFGILSNFNQTSLCKRNYQKCEFEKLCFVKAMFFFLSYTKENQAPILVPEIRPKIERNPHNKTSFID